MKYILTDEEGVTHFDSYFEYIESIKYNLPSHVYSFASDFKHYGLSNHESLHDAWLNHLNIVEPSTGNRNELREIEIEAIFLGPYHDRLIIIRYKEVMAFELQKPEDSTVSSGSATGHGDLLYHEIRLEGKATLVHEIEFSSGSVFIIKCKNILHSEQAYINA